MLYIDTLIHTRSDYVLHTTVEVLPTGKGSTNPPTKEDDNSSSTELILVHSSFESHNLIGADEVIDFP